MDIRLLAIIALIVALMEMLGKAARKRAANQEQDGSRPARADPFASVMEELEWLPMDDDQAVKPTPERAPLRSRSGPCLSRNSSRRCGRRLVRPSRRCGPRRLVEIEPPVRPSPRTVESAPPPRRTVEPALPPGQGAAGAWSTATGRRAADQGAFP